MSSKGKGRERSVLESMHISMVNQSTNFRQGNTAFPTEGKLNGMSLHFRTCFELPGPLLLLLLLRVWSTRNVMVESMNLRK